MCHHEAAVLFMESTATRNKPIKRKLINVGDTHKINGYLQLMVGVFFPDIGVFGFEALGVLDLAGVFLVEVGDEG